jgi:hypothetical protein
LEARIQPGETLGSSITLLSNGNYVIRSERWNGFRGAATWADGDTGVRGFISAANSLVGANPNDRVGYGATVLSNGNYVVSSPYWNGQRGAATWADGNTVVRGFISAANSLVGSQPNDGVGGVTVLSNGDYLVSSGWNGRGALTWADGSVGARGPVSEANSLVGSQPNDFVGISRVAPLPDGNYLVLSSSWNGRRGAVTWADASTGVRGPVSEDNSLVGSNPNDRVGANSAGESPLIVLSNGNYVVHSPFWNGNRGAATWVDGNTGVRGTVSAANSLVGSNPDDFLGAYLTNGYPSIMALSNGNYLVRSPLWNGNRGAVTFVNGTTAQTLDGQSIITPQNSVVGGTANTGLRSVVLSPDQQSFVATFVTEGSGRITVGLLDPNQLSYAHGQAQTVALTPEFLTATLNTGTDVVLQASNDITVDDPITVQASGHGGALTLQAGRSILLNAGITTDNGPLTLIANDTRANGVVDAQREPGNAFITMAGGTVLDTGTAPLTIELRDGAGGTHTASRAINLQTLSAGAVSVANTGPSAGSDLRLGPVTTSGPQSYSTPHGVTTVAGDLDASATPITFTDSVVLNAGVRVGTGSSTVNLAGTRTQTLRSGPGARISNLNHTGSCRLQLLSGLAVTGSLVQAAGTFDANDQPVTVAQAAVVTGGTYLAGTAAQTFTSGLVVVDGAFTSSTGPMTVGGGVTLTGGTFGGAGTVDRLMAFRGTVAPGTTDPGVLAVAGAVTFTPLTTFRALVNGTDPGSGYSQLQAGGPIDLGSSTLNLELGFEPPVGSRYEILTTSDPALVRGTFSGLPEGATFSQGGFTFQITYQGGAGGNSVVVTRLA